MNDPVKSFDVVREPSSGSEGNGTEAGSNAVRQPKLTHQEIAELTMCQLNGGESPPRQVVATSGSKLMRFLPDVGIWREFDEYEMGELRYELGKLLGQNVGGSVAHSNIPSVLNYMADIPGYFRPRDEFDADPDVIAFSNGLLDIESGEFRPGLHADDWLTSTVGYGYDPEAKIVEFKRVLKEILVCEDAEGNLVFDPVLAVLFREVMGYCLCQHLRGNKVFFLLGEGANGKSVLLSIIIAMVGRHMVAEAFDVRKLDDETNNALLLHKRVAIQTELDSHGLIPDGRLKAIASGEALVGKHLYQDKFEFRPYATLLMAGNSMPSTRDRSHGFWRRTVVIPFNARFVESTVAKPGEKIADPHLETKLMAELPAIFNFAYRGLKQLKANGWEFTGSDASVAATSEMRDTSDNVLAWARQCIVEAESPSEYAAHRIFQLYRSYCKENGYGPLGSQGFYTRLKRIIVDDELDMDIEQKKKNTGNFYVGQFRVLEEAGEDPRAVGWADPLRSNN